MAESCLSKEIIETNSVIGNPLARASVVNNSGDSFETFSEKSIIENSSKPAPGKPNNTVTNYRMSPAKSNSSLNSPLTPLPKSKAIVCASKASSGRRAATSSSSKSVTDQLISDLETSPMSSGNSPERKPRYTTLTNAIVTNEDLANELLERAEKKQKKYPYPDKMDVLLAAMQNESPVKPPRKEEFNKLDANELLSILEDGAEVHYVEKPSRPRAPRVARSFYKNIKLDPEVEKRLALKQLMEFTRKRGRPRKSETENNNNKTNVNNINATPRPTSSEARSPKKIKRTPNRELNRLLQDEGAINMLYSIEKGENESKCKLLPSKRRMKKALMKKAQEVTEALLGGSGNSGVSLRHHRSMEKRKLSTDSLDSEHSEFQFAAPSDSRIIRRHSSSSSLSSSRASSPRMSSPPPPIKQEEGTRMSEKTEKLIDAKCKELNLQPEHSQMIKKLIQDKQNGFKERLQSEFASKLRAAISRSKNQDKSGNGGNRSSSPCEMSVWKMVEEDWGSDGGSESEPDKEDENEMQNSTIQQPSPARSEGKNEQKNGEMAKSSPLKDKEGSRMPLELGTYREISLEVIEGLACLCVETRTSHLPHALTTKVLRELSQALEYVSQSPDTKAIGISCRGADFCLGFDLPGLLSTDTDERRSLAAQAALAIKELACKVCMLGKPLIAGVRGRAVGLGVILLAYCDMVLAEPNATFTAPYPRLACFPEAAATTLLPHVIGLAHTKKLLVSCARLNSAEAEACGLVTRVIPEGLLKERVVAAGKDFMSQSQHIVASTKAVLMHGLRTKIPSVLNTEVKLLQQHWVTEDCQGRIRDLEKNPIF